MGMACRSSLLFLSYIEARKCNVHICIIDVATQDEDFEKVFRVEHRYVRVKK
jgi:glutamate synthase domain-containing protein 2